MRFLIPLAIILILPNGAVAKHFYDDWCAERIAENPGVDPSSLLLPPDPRSLATHETGYRSSWVDCHEPLPADYTQPDGTPVHRPQNCAEWESFAAEGKRILEQEALIGSIGVGSLATYTNLWKAWGLDERPDNFDELVIERYGLQEAPFDNSYCTDDGVCGDLPMGLVQADDGGLGITCLFCHSGRVGDDDEGPGSIVGIGNNTFDAQLLHHDTAKAGAEVTPLPYPHNITRGSINAVSDFEFLMFFRDFDTLDVSPFVKTFPIHPSPGDQDPPNWWNTGMRPRVYMDGGVSADSTRALMMFLAAKIDENGEWIRNQEQLFEAIRTYIDSIEPPAFPGQVDEQLAAQGEELFHTIDLGTPIGNGSCASCHGVYSETYAKPTTRGGALPAETETLDPEDWPKLVGIAGQIVPRDVIGTDPARVDALSEQLRWGWGTTWWGYPDLVDGYTPPSEKDPFTEAMDDYQATEESNEIAAAAGAPRRVQGVCNWEQDEIGYAAPPLHGIWASSPYFHNGSVPTVWHVLSPQERPTVWRRTLSDGEPLRDGVFERGFSTSLDDYDFERLGWQIDTEPRLPCGVLPLEECAPAQVAFDTALATAFRAQGAVIWHGLQWPPPEGREMIERRKVYDTRLYGKSNQGHSFTAILDEFQRRALIEYLKTL